MLQKAYKVLSDVFCSFDSSKLVKECLPHFRYEILGLREVEQWETRLRSSEGIELTPKPDCRLGSFKSHQQERQRCLGHPRVYCDAFLNFRPTSRQTKLPTERWNIPNQTQTTKNGNYFFLRGGRWRWVPAWRVSTTLSSNWPHASPRFSSTKPLRL